MARNKLKLKNGIVVAPQPLAVEEGARVLKAGGNAFDAAIAAAFVQMVTDPQMGGVGGFGCMTVYDAARDTVVVIDFNATAGKAATADQWTKLIVEERWDGYGWVLDGFVNDVGYGAVATPGTVAGLAELHRRFASLPWSDLLQPAIRIARDGFLVSPELARRWVAPAMEGAPSSMSRLGFNDESRRLYLDAAAKPRGVGERFRNPDYAATLEHLAERGPDEFYTGDLARRIADDLEANGSTVRLADLQSYAPRTQEPIMGSYLGHDIATNNPPGGGVTLLGMLNILEHYDLPKLGHNTEEYLVTVARAQIAAMCDRAEHVGDPAFVEVPVAMLASKERANSWCQRIDSNEHLIVPRYQPDSPTTTHVTVVDAFGNCVALTHTLGASSGAITPGLGFMYNNAMNCFDPRPGTVNSIAPGKGRITGIAPTIAFTDGRPSVVLGAPGGTRIMTGILQALVNILAFKMTAVEAVSAPRFDCQSDTLDGEARIPSWVKEAAAERAGLKLWPNPAPYGNFALVQAALLNHDTGRVTGGADPRSGGAVITV
jgi:gamma-glutamyltranspeptidase/glutathione hydrolase